MEGAAAAAAAAGLSDDDLFAPLPEIDIDPALLADDFGAEGDDALFAGGGSDGGGEADQLRDVNALVASLLRNRERRTSSVGRVPAASSAAAGRKEHAAGPRDGGAESATPAVTTTTTPSAARQGTAAAAAADSDVDDPPPWEATRRAPSGADDFIRNFLVRHALRRSLDAFNAEWYALQTQAQAQQQAAVSSGGAIVTSTAAASALQLSLQLPDVYAQNEALAEEVARLGREAAHAREVAARAQATWDAFRRERDVHRMHHRRLLQEKAALGTDLRRLRAHADALAPLVEASRLRLEAAVRDKAVARLERDRALARAAAAEAQLADAGIAPQLGPTPGPGGVGTLPAPAAVDAAPSPGTVLAVRRAAAAAGATGAHWQLRQAPTYGASPGGVSVGTLADGTHTPAAPPPHAAPETRLTDGSTGIPGRAIKRSVARAAAQAAALAAEARLPHDDQVNPFLELTFEPARAERYDAGAPARSWAAHGAPVAGLAIHPTKPVIVTASDDRSWRLWAVRLPGAEAAGGGGSGGGSSADDGGTGDVSPRPGSSGAAAVAAAGRRHSASRGSDGYHRDVTDGVPGCGKPSREATLGLDSSGDTATGSGSGSARGGAAGAAATTVRTRPPPLPRGLALDADADATLVMSGSGHRSWLADAAFDPAGGTLATASGDGVVKLWSLASSRCVATLTEHTQAAWGVAWSTDGAFLATASMDHTARVWDAGTGRSRVALRGHVDAVNAVAWQPYSPNVATASADKTVSLWDVRAGQCVQTFFGHSNAVHDVAVSLRGDTVVSVDADGWARVWDLRMVCQSAAERVHPAGGAALAVCLDRSGTVLAAGCDDGVVRVLALPSGTADVAAGAAAAGAFGRAFSSGGLPLDGGYGDAAAGLPGLTLLAALRHGAAAGGGSSGSGGCAVQAVGFDPTSSFLASAGDDGVVRLWADPCPPGDDE